MPKEEGFENGLKMLREGYNYIPNRNKVYQSDVFETTLLGKKRSQWVEKKRGDCSTMKVK